MSLCIPCLFVSTSTLLLLLQYESSHLLLLFIGTLSSLRYGITRNSLIMIIGVLFTALRFVRSRFQSRFECIIVRCTLDIQFDEKSCDDRRSMDCTR